MSFLFFAALFSSFFLRSGARSISTFGSFRLFLMSQVRIPLHLFST